MKRVYKIALLIGISIGISSCHSNTAERNVEYMPNMYESVAYETYTEADAFRGGVSAQVPPAGTIKQGFVPYELPNTNEGYEQSKAVTRSALDSTAVADMEKAKGLFDIYCAICHGTAGDGQGKLVKQQKFLGVPSYKDRVITVGSVFHVETYGLNAMGSYANQLTPNERWLVAEYVMKLKSEL
ncbi:MAG TPA: cytochrome c [Flavobacterium sp.]|jgi:mono/diheme cytochrome c family protein